MREMLEQSAKWHSRIRQPRCAVCATRTSSKKWPPRGRDAVSARGPRCRHEQGL